MASPNIYTRSKGRDFTNTENPLDRAVGDFEVDDPIRPTQRQWGWFPFLYESVDSFDIGGDGGILFAGGDYGVPSIDLWQFPNAEQFAGVQLPDVTAPAEDLVRKICIEGNLTKNEELQGWCQAAGRNDGCLQLLAVFPSIDGDGSSVVGISGILFPNGYTADTFNEGPFTLRGDIFLYRIIVFDETHSQVLDCQAFYFKPPQPNDGNIPIGSNDVLVRANFSRARDAVLQCIADRFGGDFSGLGCVN